MSYYPLFDDPIQEDISISYWFDEQFPNFDAPPEPYGNFGNIVDSVFVYSPRQYDVRKYGFSTVYYEGSPTVYHPGDCIDLPYQKTEISTLEAVGLAWAAFASGVVPET